MRKLKKVKAQREEWNAIEAKGEVVKAWQPKKSQKPKQGGKMPQKRSSKKKACQNGHQRRKREWNHPNQKKELKKCQYVGFCLLS